MPDRKDNKCNVETENYSTCGAVRLGLGGCLRESGGCSRELGSCLRGVGCCLRGLRGCVRGLGGYLRVEVRVGMRDLYDGRD